MKNMLIKENVFNKMGSFLFYVILFTPLFFITRCIDKNQAPKIRKRVEEIYMNGNYVIGTVSGGSYTIFNNGGSIMFSGVSYGFKVPVSNKNPKGYEARCLQSGLAKQISKETYRIYNGFAALVKRKDKFLVLYDEDNPKNAILLLDHPIKSDADFERYKAEIEELRKDPKWRGYE